MWFEDYMNEKSAEELEQEREVLDYGAIQRLVDENFRIDGGQTAGEFLNELVDDAKAYYYGDEQAEWLEPYFYKLAFLQKESGERLIRRYISMSRAVERGGTDLEWLHILCGAIQDIPKFVAL